MKDLFLPNEEIFRLSIRKREIMKRHNVLKYSLAKNIYLPKIMKEGKKKKFINLRL